MNKQEKSQKKINFTALGLIIGSAIGAGLGLILFENLAVVCGAGAGVGLVVGAVIDLQKNK